MSDSKNNLSSEQIKEIRKIDRGKPPGKNAFFFSNSLQLWGLPK